jgi:hypothetical protein
MKTTLGTIVNRIQGVESKTRKAGPLASGSVFRINALLFRALNALIGCRGYNAIA